jgi:hypothetical protein
MTNIVMAIALWCGSPSTRTDGMTRPEVDKCRKELFACVEKDQNGTKFLECFKDKKLSRD